MSRCFRFHLYVFLRAWWLPLMLAVFPLLMGWEAAAACGSYVRRLGRQAPETALALLLDLRHFIPLAGAVWSGLFLGMDFPARGVNVLLSRGFSRFRVFGSKYVLFLTGCAIMSLLEQGFALLLSVPLWKDVSALLLLRNGGLRLLLDLGMMVLPSVFPLLGKGNVYLRLPGLVYGLVLWRLMGAHYGLWLPVWSGPPGWGELWPLPALALGIGGSALALRRAEV